MARTKYGYLHSHFGPDMDGCSRSFTWVENVRPEEDDAYELRAGWFAMCEVEPDAGWVGPFRTEAEAVRAATTEEGLVSFMYGDDPMSDHHGRNAR